MEPHVVSACLLARCVRVCPVCVPVQTRHRRTSRCTPTPRHTRLSCLRGSEERCPAVHSSHHGVRLSWRPPFRGLDLFTWHQRTHCILVHHSMARQHGLKSLWPGGGHSGVTCVSEFSCRLVHTAHVWRVDDLICVEYHRWRNSEGLRMECAVCLFVLTFCSFVRLTLEGCVRGIRRSAFVARPGSLAFLLMRAAHAVCTNPWSTATTIHKSACQP